MQKDPRPAEVSGRANPRQPKMLMAQAFARMVDLCGKCLIYVQ